MPTDGLRPYRAEAEAQAADQAQQVSKGWLHKSYGGLGRKAAAPLLRAAMQPQQGMLQLYPRQGSAEQPIHGATGGTFFKFIVSIILLPSLGVVVRLAS